MAQKGVKMRECKKDQLLRMDIIAKLYKRGFSYREMQNEVKARLDLETYSLRTVHKDVNRLLEEWREMRIENFDHNVQLELERIDELIKEAWEAWDRSKTNITQRSTKQKGVPNVNEETRQRESLSVLLMEQTAKEINQYGDPRYLDLVHKLLCERRRILGLYSPEKHDVSGNLSFANLLMETGIIDESQ